MPAHGRYATLTEIIGRRASGQLVTAAERLSRGRIFAGAGWALFPSRLPSSSKQASSLRADSSQVKRAERSSARAGQSIAMGGRVQEHPDRAGDRGDVESGRNRRPPRRRPPAASRPGLKARACRRPSPRRRAGRSLPAATARSRHKHVDTDGRGLRPGRSRPGSRVRASSCRAMASRICGHVGVEDVVHVADQDELHIGGRALGEGFHQAQQVLVRAQTADVKQKTPVRGDAQSG